MSLRSIFRCKTFINGIQIHLINFAIETLRNYLGEEGVKFFLKHVSDDSILKFVNADRSVTIHAQTTINAVVLITIPIFISNLWVLRCQLRINWVVADTKFTF